MIKFNFKGIEISAIFEMEQHHYKDFDNRQKIRFEKKVHVFVKFWDYKLWDENLQEFAFIKSTLQSFMHACKKEGRKITLAKYLRRNDQHWGDLTLWFVARQKNNQYFLQVCLQKAGNTINEIFLDGQEVLMLDIAIGKAIGLLSPESVEDCC
jgi:hypothetical protein